MNTNAALAEAFRETIHIAALADYFLIGEQLKVGDDRETIASEPVALGFLELFEALGIGCKGFIDERDSTFIHLEFHSPAEKERADEYFTSFNLGVRPKFGIPMPDIYEGQLEPVEKICSQYQTTIHHFFIPDSGRPLRIPIGRDIARIAAMAKATVGQFRGIDEGERAGRTILAEFTEEGLRGFAFFSE